jgi:hypothetical protein
VKSSVLRGQVCPARSVMRQFLVTNRLLEEASQPDKSPHDSCIFTAQVREKFGAYPGNKHISGEPPNKAFYKNWVVGFYMKTRKINDWDKMLEDFIDLDASADEWSKKRWNTDQNDPAGA